MGYPTLSRRQTSGPRDSLAADESKGGELMIATREVAERIGIPFSSLRVYMSKGIVSKPSEKGAKGRHLWSAEEAEKAKQEYLSYRHTAKKYPRPELS